MLKEQGLDWRALLAAGEPDFTAMGATEVVSGITSVSLEPAEIKVALEPASEVAPTPAPINKPNPLLAYSLTGMREELQREARERIRSWAKWLCGASTPCSSLPLIQEKPY